MPTLVLNAYSSSYPTITNRIRASIYLQSDPQAFITSQIQDAPHPVRIWSFPGLPRENYGFVMDEVDSSLNVVRTLAQFDVVPGEIEGTLSRDDEQIQVDTTVGFTSGNSNAIFDGTDGAPDYRGWEIVPSELTGRGILVRGVDYSWDKFTGAFALLQMGDVFSANTWYNIHFDPINNSVGNSYPTIGDFEINLVTSDTTIDYTYFGAKLIVEPSGVYAEITLPNIATVPQGRRMFIEIGGSHLSTVKFITYGSDTINFLDGNLYALPGESFSIYKFNRSGVPEWRLCDIDGRFKDCGSMITEDQVQSGVYNKQLLDGTVGNILKHARLYNEFILRLPLEQVVAYSSWSGVNRQFYSFADGSGNFYFPDRRSLFERNAYSGLPAGTYQADTVGPHSHSYTKQQGNAYTGNPTIQRSGSGSANPIDFTLYTDTYNSGGETQPKNYFVNKYVIL